MPGPKVALKELRSTRRGSGQGEICSATARKRGLYSGGRSAALLAAARWLGQKAGVGQAGQRMAASASPGPIPAPKVFTWECTWAVENEITMAAYWTITWHDRDPSWRSCTAN